MGDEALLLPGFGGLGGGLVAHVDRPADLVGAIGKGAVGRDLGETEGVPWFHLD